MSRRFMSLIGGNDKMTEVNKHQLGSGGNLVSKYCSVSLFLSLVPLVFLLR